MRLKLLDLLYRWKNWLVSLFCPSRLERELEIEMQDHLQSLQQEFEREGMSSEAARKAALRGFGNVESLKEDCRDSRSIRVITDLVRDIRYSIRSLRKSKRFTLGVVVTLAFCIGANTTVFSVLYDLVLKSLPFENSERIVHIFLESDQRPIPGSGIGWNQYLDYRQQTHLFEAVAISDPVTKVYEFEELVGRRVTADFFDVMRVQPILGRFFSPEETQPESSPIVVLAQTTWENSFASDPDVLGKRIRFLNEEVPYTVIGVAPRSLEIFDARICYFIPKIPGGNDLDPQRRRGWLRSDFWARLKPGVTHEAVTSQMVSIERRWYEEVANAKSQTIFERFKPRFTVGRPKPLKSRMVLLQAGALFVLLVGCANIFNLMLSRTSKRMYELSVRHSFGARKFILSRLMLIESMLLSVGGCICGSVLAWIVFKGINRYLAIVYPQLAEVGFGGVFWASILIVGGAISLLIGLFPLALFWRSGQVAKVNSSARSSSASGGSRTLSNGLVISQVAVTFALLVGAGLLFRSFSNLMAVDPGFDPNRVVAGSVNLAGIYNFSHPSESISVRKRIGEAMREIPGVESVAFQSTTTGTVGTLLQSQVSPVAVLDTPFENLDNDSDNKVIIRAVSSGYFLTMGIPIIEGRGFQPGDTKPYEPGQQGARTSYIIDETFSNTYLEGKPGVGSYVKSGFLNKWWLPVVGIVSRVNLEGLENRDGMPVLFVCNDETPYRRYTILLRTERPADSVLSEMRVKLREINPGIYLYNAGSLETSFNNLHLDRQVLTVLLVIFASLALILSGIGIFGVLSYDVEQRQREIGIRSAIGASRGGILGMILRQGLWKTGIGLALGFLGSLYLSRFLESQLFDVTVLDSWVYALATLFTLLVAFFASYLPAKSALRINTLEALRWD